jgi:hypothetical protein
MIETAYTHHVLSTKPGEQRLMQQYGSAEAITSCAWLNETSAPLLIAGMGGKWLRLYDIRCKYM